MPTAQKFKFDECFDAFPSSTSSAYDGQLKTLSPSPPAESETFSAEDLANAETAAFTAGHAAAMAEAARDASQVEAAALSVVGRQLDQLGGDLQQALQATRQGAIAIAAAIARKMVPGLVRARAMEEIETLFTDCISRLLDEPRIVIRLHETMMPNLQGKLTELAQMRGFTGHLIFLEEPDLNDVDCRIEWADGGAERDTGKLWQEVDQIIARYLTDPALRPAPPIPDIPPEASSAPDVLPEDTCALTIEDDASANPNLLSPSEETPNG